MPHAERGPSIAPEATQCTLDGVRTARESGSVLGRRRDEEDREPPCAPEDGCRELELLDPAARHAAALGLAAALPSTSPAPSEAILRPRSLEELLPVLVRRIAWAGDKHKATVHLELGAGAYAGARVVVEVDRGRVKVDISGSEGPELDRLRLRVDARLRDHGLDVDSVT